jgi:single-strand DNA-binding protein
MAGETQITVVGNLVADVDLRFTPSGVAVAKFRIASTPRYRDSATGEFKDGESLFIDVSVWRQQAENAAETLQRGMRCFVVGALKQRSYEKDGQKRSVYEITAEDVGPSLRNASAKVTKSQRSQPAQGQRQQAEDPWASGPADDSVPPF